VRRARISKLALLFTRTAACATQAPFPEKYMNRIELVETIAEKHALSKAEAGRVLDTILEAIVGTVKKGGAVSLMFKSAAWGFSPNGDDHVFFCEPDSVELILSKEYNRHKGEVAELDARTMFQSKIYSALQLIAKNRSRLGVAFAA
jgi:hypothetical protein